MKQELLFKILVIGELGTGKTAFIKRYVHDFFSENYRATIGVDFALKVIEHGDGEEEGSRIRLQLWDIAGQERFGNMTRVYYRVSFRIVRRLSYGRKFRQNPFLIDKTSKKPRYFFH